MKEPVVLSWSGGKDSAMALHELLGDGTYEVVSLLTTVSEEFRRISHHGVRESLLDEQAKAIGIPVRKAYLPSGPAGGCTNEVYESIMKEVMLAFRGTESALSPLEIYFYRICASGAKRTSLKSGCAEFFRSGIE